MNTMEHLKRALTATLLMGALALGGCQADGDPSDLDDRGDDIVDVANCQVPVGQRLCVLGGDDHPGGIVDVLLDTNGPLGPIAGAVDASALTDVLEDMLENDGDLVSLLTNLFANGQLQEGLQRLLLGDAQGNGGLAEFGNDLLLGNDEADGLRGLFGEDGIVGLLEALAMGGGGSECKAPIGTLCLISDDDDRRSGLINLLAADDGALAALSPRLGEITDDLVTILGDMLQSNGSLPDLFTQAIEEGNLAAGLELLLLGTEDSAEPGLVTFLENLLSSTPTIVTQIIDALTSLFGPPPAP